MAPRVLIFGTGSIGATYAFILSRAIPESNIITVCRSNYSAARTSGFTINSSLWGENLKVRPVVVRSVDEAAALNDSAPFDYILICSKALPTNPSTAELLKPAISPNTTIVLIQNGLAIEEPYSKLYPENPLLSTVVYLPATQISPGVIQHKEVAHLHIGSYPATPQVSNHAAHFAALIKAGGGTVEIHPDVQFERWSKLLVNASWNPMCALSRSADAALLAATPLAEGLVREVMLEIAAVAQKCGYERIDAELVEYQLKRATVREVPGVAPSMLSDALGGRSMEVEAIVGSVVRIAREKGVQIPMLRTLYVLATGLNRSFGNA
ncbi:hypothetical protein VTL71DRAFT_16392 [Oculimacula yallundae]|uniref:2-dehydropantoate 2-reductase n=1 Tax=Oculimacula yallundae TaxID=86028 RepID=A0ABR4CEA1_9HELO